MTWSRRFRIGVLMAAAAAAFAVSATLWLPALLIAPAGSGRADAAILLVGNAPPGPGRDLVLSRYRSGAIRYVACASAPTYVGIYPADASCRELGDLGVPPDRRLIVHLPQTECGREKLPTLIALARGQGWRSVQLVVSPEGSRATRRLATRDFAGAGIEAWVTYAEPDRADLVNGWWRTHRKAQRMIGAALGNGLDLFYRQCQ